MAELHITSCVAYAKPEATQDVIRAIRAAGIAEVPRHDDRGHIVLLIERPNTGAILDVIDAIRALPGVLAVHMAYQHAEDFEEAPPCK
jgi:nitrate reductase NapAB chaperone NapD